MSETPDTEKKKPGRKPGPWRIPPHTLTRPAAGASPQRRFYDQ